MSPGSERVVVPLADLDAAAAATVGPKAATLAALGRAGLPVPDALCLTAGAYRGSGATAPDWHNAPRKQFAINMTGELEVELTDGTRRKIGSDLVFLEDTTGKGHVTRALGPITNVFLHVPDDFDVVAWAKGQ